MQNLHHAAISMTTDNTQIPTAEGMTNEILEKVIRIVMDENSSITVFFLSSYKKKHLF